MHLRLFIFVALTCAAASANAGLLRPSRPPVERIASKVGDWRLDISRNKFSGEIACRMRARNGRAIYIAHAVGFRFRRNWDVDGAVYRLDGGPPRASRDDLPELVALGTPIDRGGMDNASGGIVWVPFARLESANSITIEPRRDRAPRTFHFRGLKGLHEVAVARGCSPDARFVER